MKRALVVVAVLVAGLAAWTVRVVVGGERALDASDAALDRGDADAAIAEARRAASFYAPGAPHIEQAYRRLGALARAAEEHHRRDTALYAWRAVRQAALDTRWLVTPHASDEARAASEIARLSALGRHERAEPDRAIEAAELARLRSDERPRTLWVVFLVLGLALSSGGFAFAAQRVAGVARLEWEKGTRPLVVGAVGLALWLLAWWRA
ncbi:MAG: hypothetical protein FJ095_05780 [Deltaproteobacteria bacterium]|nr:hypothetical protein [Deltaproteobacteria bacterium]